VALPGVPDRIERRRQILGGPSTGIKRWRRKGLKVSVPFALVACQLLGWRGFEMALDPAYCDVSLKRMEALNGLKGTRQSQGLGGESLTVP
jgi:hypothetical protein